MTVTVLFYLYCGPLLPYKEVVEAIVRNKDVDESSFQKKESMRRSGDQAIAYINYFGKQAVTDKVPSRHF